MNEKRFHEKDLVLAKWQYMIRHESTSSFRMDEVVFLKSNPEVPLTVRRLGGKQCKLSDKIVDSVYVTSGPDREQVAFPPECILQYKYAGLKISSDGRFKVSLN